MPTTEETEPIWWLSSVPYSDYRTSAWWRKRRNEYRDTVKRESGADVLYCEVCTIVGVPRQNFLRFHVHHVSYENLGHELDEDLLLVCSACHNAIHCPDSHAAQKWRAQLPEEFHQRLDELAK